MKTKLFSIFLLSVLTIGSLSPVASQITAVPATASSAVSEFDVNGMKVLIKRRPGTPTVSAGLFFRGGVRNMMADTAGLEAFTLSVATEGSKNFPRTVLRKETARIGTVIAPGSSYDFSALALGSTKENFDLSWRMFTDVALNPTFAAESVERVRTNILTALKSESDSPEGSLELLNKRTVFEGHPYKNGPEGTSANIGRFKAADLAAHHKNLMQTSRLLLVVVGDVEPEALRQRVAATFGSLPRGEYKETAVPTISFLKPTVEITEKSLQTDYVKGVFAAPSIRDADYYAMRVAITILQTNVFQEVRVKRNLSYAPDASLDERSANTASISVSSVNPNEAISVMLDEIKKLREQPNDEADLAGMAGFFLTTHYLKQETNAAQVADLAQYELIGGGWRNSLAFLDRIRQVKPAEVQDAAKKYMKNVRFVVVGDPKRIDKTIFLQAAGN